MNQSKKISTTGPANNRRGFLKQALQITGLTLLSGSLQKAWGNGSSAVIKKLEHWGRSIGRNMHLDKLVLNTKSKVVHLPTDKIFANYQDIAEKNRKIINMKTWELQVKQPLHFAKGKSGIILEMLALQKLTTGINDRNLTAASNTLALAFSKTYRDKNTIVINRFNFRVHDLLLQTISLNNTIPPAKKWDRFQVLTGKFNYGNTGVAVFNTFKLPGRMNWLSTKTEFDKRVSYILMHKTEYINRLKKRAADHKLI